jgi:hypothetical protein
MSAAFRLLANAFEMMRGRPADDQGSGENDLLANMIEVLRQNADDPPTELKGVPDSFLDELERVPKKSLKPTDTCPICVNPFLEGEYMVCVDDVSVWLTWSVQRPISACGPTTLPQGPLFRSGLHKALAQAQLYMSTGSQRAFEEETAAPSTCG